MTQLIFSIFALIYFLATLSQASFSEVSELNANEITIKPSKIQRIEKIAYKLAASKFDYKGYVDPNNIKRLVKYILGSNERFQNKRDLDDGLDSYMNSIYNFFGDYEHVIPDNPAQMAAEDEPQVKVNNLAGN